MMLFDSIKDQAAQYAARQFINSKYEKYGQVTRLQIDKQARTIDLEFNLKGEAQPITAQVNGYELTEAGGKTYLKLSRVNISREWMDVAYQEFACGKVIEVPSLVRSLL